MSRVLFEVSLSLGLLNLLIAGLVISNRFIVRIRDRRHAAAVERLRPVLLDWIEGDADTIPPPSTRAERRALLELLSKYGRSLTGDSRKQVTQLARDLDLMVVLLSETRSFRAWKRAAAAFRIGDVGDRQSTRLVHLLSDRDRRVRNAATRSLGKQRAVEGVAPIVLALSDGGVARAVGGQALLDIGPAAATSLVGLMASQNPEVRAAAAELLGRIGSAEHGRTLVHHLHDPAANVRVAIVRALGRLGGSAASEAIPQMLDDQVPYVRAAAATAVGVLGSPTDVPRLLKLVVDPDHLPAHAAASALAELDPEAALLLAEQTSNRHLLAATDLQKALR